MLTPQVDGLAVLPELTDDAILVSNLLDRPVRGRDRIAKVMRALDDHFVAITDIERINSAGHRIIDSRALLPSGDRVHVTVYATRNEDGWISEVSLTLETGDALPDLTRIVQSAAK
jgi:hypothetical protein